MIWLEWAALTAVLFAGAYLLWRLLNRDHFGETAEQYSRYLHMLDERNGGEQARYGRLIDPDEYRRRKRAFRAQRRRDMARPRVGVGRVDFRD